MTCPKVWKTTTKKPVEGGRDGLGGKCICYYSYRDVHKLEQLLKDKSVTERQRGMQLIEETVAYMETAICRRKYVLDYFGEEYTSKDCSESKKCDNCKNPRPTEDATDAFKTALESISNLNEMVDQPYLVKFLQGKKTQKIEQFNHHIIDGFGKLKEKDDAYLNALIRQGILSKHLRKDIEQYGLLKTTDKGATCSRKHRVSLILLRTTILRNS